MLKGRRPPGGGRGQREAVPRRVSGSRAVPSCSSGRPRLPLPAPWDGGPFTEWPARVWLYGSVLTPLGYGRDQIWAPARRGAVEAGRAARSALRSARETVRQARRDAWRALVGGAREPEPREPGRPLARTLGSTTTVPSVAPEPEISSPGEKKPSGGEPDRTPRATRISRAAPHRVRPAPRRRTTGQATARRPAARTGGAAHPTALHQARPPPVHQSP